MTRTKWPRTKVVDLGLALLAAIALVGSAVLLWPHDRSARYERATPDSGSAATMLFIGDSYAGSADPGETSYACVAAVKMGWRCDLAAVPGTGFFGGGSANRFVSNKYTGEQTTSFAERITQLHTVYRPDIVVFDGGRNDGLLGPAQLFQTMAYTLDLAHQTWPDAHMVVIRPRFLARPSDDLGLDDAFFARLMADPRAHGTKVIDPIRSLAIGTNTAPLVAADGVHPNLSGQRELGNALFASLPSSGLGSST